MGILFSFPLTGEGYLVKLRNPVLGEHRRFPNG